MAPIVLSLQIDQPVPVYGSADLAFTPSIMMPHHSLHAPLSPSHSLSFDHSSFQPSLALHTTVLYDVSSSSFSTFYPSLSISFSAASVSPSSLAEASPVSVSSLATSSRAPAASGSTSPLPQAPTASRVSSRPLRAQPSTVAPLAPARTTRRRSAATKRLHQAARAVLPGSPLSAARAEALAAEDVLLLMGPLPEQVSERWARLLPADRWRLQVALSCSVAVSTLKKYASGVRVFLRWCDANDVPLIERLPTSEPALLRFFMTELDEFRASTQSKRRSALELWHKIHGFPFNIDDDTCQCLGRAAKILQPEPLPSRDPVRLDDLRIIRAALNVNSDRAHAAVWACVSFAFFGLARLGELTVESHKPEVLSALRSLRSHWTLRSESGSVAPTVVLHLPQDKVQGTDGSDLIAARQAPSPDLCPVAAVQFHLRANEAVPASAGAFAYIDKNGRVREMTSDFCTTTVNRALQAAGRPTITGHCFRIGGTTFYLAAGVPDIDIRRHGRWASDAYLIYLRRLYVSAGRIFADVDPTHG
ncbi:hypothetical protein A4X06_0g8834 [Tilletia controversa]|uniref:Tyr recombinase domain-containing protein n=1 Tax=Tilletia controversa TaxID=13291 RepID=A0A8X7SST4_9BASI|nr:hypothetical protein A4X06_0g8834 [Tilletia controversa]